MPLLDGHVHGPDCGHETVPHDDHFDYLVRYTFIQFIRGFSLQSVYIQLWTQDPHFKCYTLALHVQSQRLMPWAAYSLRSTLNPLRKPENVSLNLFCLQGPCQSPPGSAPPEVCTPVLTKT